MQTMTLQWDMLAQMYTLLSFLLPWSLLASLPTSTHATDQRRSVIGLDKLCFGYVLWLVEDVRGMWLGRGGRGVCNGVEWVVFQG